jgi:hypothetical protein
MAPQHRQITQIADTFKLAELAERSLPTQLGAWRTRYIPWAARDMSSGGPIESQLLIPDAA